MLPELLYTRVEADFSPRFAAGWQCIQASENAVPADLDRLIDAVALWEEGDPLVGNFQVSGNRWLRVFVSPLDNSTPGYNNVVDASFRRGVAIFHAFAYPRDKVARVAFPSTVRTLDELVHRIESIRETDDFNYFANPVIAYGGR